MLRWYGSIVLIFSIGWTATVLFSSIALKSEICGIAPDARLPYPESTGYLNHNDRLRLVLGVDVLNSKRPQLFILGPSAVNSMFFSTQAMQDLFPSLRIQNLSVGAMLAREQSETVNYLLMVLSEKSKSTATFIFGVSYYSFMPIKRYSDELTEGSYLTKEFRRWPSFFSEPGKPRFSLQWLAPYRQLVSPYLILTCLKSKITHMRNNFQDKLINSFSRPTVTTGEQPKNNGSVVREGNLAQSPHWLRHLSYRRNMLGKVDNGYFGDELKPLLKMIDRLKKIGAHVIILDMPIASLFRGSPEYLIYRAEISPQLRNSGTIYLDMSDALKDNEFRDMDHPNQKFSEKHINLFNLMLKQYKQNHIHEH